MKKRLTTLAIALASLLPSMAQEWLDVTSGYIANPKFTSDASGWEISVPNAQSTGRQTGTYTNGTVKLSTFLQAYSDWDDLGSGTMRQFVSLNKGQYRFEVDGIATVQSWWWSTPANNVYLYVKANGKITKKAISTESDKPQHYSIDFTLAEKGEVELGILLDNTDATWVAVDNFILKWYGNKVGVTGAEITEKNIYLVPTEEHYLSTITMPEDATYRNFTWTTSNVGVAKVDATGKVTGVREGTCTITATSVDNEAVKATCEVTVESGIAKEGSIVINEIMAANIDVYMDPSFNYGSWVELYNPTDRSVLLGGMYVTDDVNNLKQHQLIDTYGALPAHGFAILNFDHHELYTKPSYRQIDGKLDCDGGVIMVTDGSKILAQTEYPEAKGRISYARLKDGGNEWGLTGNPTPGSSNATSSFAKEQLEAPKVNFDGQKFTGRLTVKVEIPEGAKLIYTTNGSTPTLTNGSESKTGNFSVAETSTYRFRLFKDGYLPSRVVTRTYIYDSGYPLPIISVVTQNDNIYSTEYGVFKQGPNGRAGAGQDQKCNWNMDWDRPVNFEYITEDNEYAISQEVDFSMCGGWSRAWTPHSFKLKASKVYDLENTLDYQFFPCKPYLKHKTLQIRNGGNDNGNRIKDAALQEVIRRSNLYVDGQAWQPVHVFINGEYYDILNMREPNNKHFAYSNYGIDTDDIDQFEMSPDSGYVQMEGTDEKFLEWYSLSSKCADDEVYDKICQMVDIDEYINYMAVELYLGGTDWPQNNVKGFRDRNDGKFHFVLFDLDHAFGTTSSFSTFAGKKTYTFDSPKGTYWDGTAVKRKSGEIKFVTIFINMLKNERFRKQFIDSYCLVGGSVFEPTRSKQIITEMADYNSNAGLNSWSTANDIINKLQSRLTTMISTLRNYTPMKLSNTSIQNVTLSSNIDQAGILVNGLPVPTGKFNGKLFSPITLTACPPAGYEFVGWTSETGGSTKSILISGTSWKYYDKGSLDGKDWMANSFSETGWSAGVAPIGYGKNQKSTVASNKSCYYFRKTFTLADAPSSTDEYKLDFTIDDGMIVYVNGKEAGRYNMPNGTVNYNTLSSTYAEGNPDTGTMTINSSLLQRGTNVIAVEVHNNNTSSSDILWDAALNVETKISDSPEIISADIEYEMPNSGSVNLTAIYKPISDEDLIAQGFKPVMVNEVSSANSIYVNDYFKKNDWIELYNTTGNDIDIAGMYISDNVNKPDKYQVPSDDVKLNTIIPAHGFKVIWADKLDNNGKDIHTSFKLAAEGGDIVITTEEFADTLTYEAHLGNQTFGRYPDGAQKSFVMNVPSIGKPNQLNTYDSKPHPDYTGIETPNSKESGIVIAYVDGIINAKSEYSAIKHLTVHTVSGLFITESAIMRDSNSFASIKVSDLAKGIYIAHVITENGDESHIKFIIK